jgi:hypothetical protein
MVFEMISVLVSAEQTESLWIGYALASRVLKDDLVADPGNGKTMGIRDLIRTTGSPSGMLSGRSYPILAVTAPKNDESEQALGNYLFTALGLSLRGPWSSLGFSAWLLMTPMISPWST